MFSSDYFQTHLSTHEGWMGENYKGSTVVDHRNTERQTQRILLSRSVINLCTSSCNKYCLRSLHFIGPPEREKWLKWTKREDCDDFIKLPLLQKGWFICTRAEHEFAKTFSHVVFLFFFAFLLKEKTYWLRWWVKCVKSCVTHAVTLHDSAQLHVRDLEGADDNTLTHSFGLKFF